jgi:hypothetical protein
VFCDGCSDNEDRDIGDAHADDDEDSCLVYWIYHITPFLSSNTS